MKKNTTKEFQSEHKLDFEVAEWRPTDSMPVSLTWQKFRVGTCDGLWGVTKDSYNILAIRNRECGNGHLNDVFQWFENSCKRDNKSLRVLEIGNTNFMTHLVVKRGFKEIDSVTVEKKFITKK